MIIIRQQIEVICYGELSKACNHAHCVVYWLHRPKQRRNFEKLACFIEMFRFVMLVI